MGCSVSQPKTMISNPSQLHVEKFLSPKTTTDDLAGIQYFGEMNSKQRYFLPSGENYFSNFRVEKLMLDTGSALHLLPIIANDADFARLSASFPSKCRTLVDSDFSWRIKCACSNGAGSLGLVLVIELDPSSELFEVMLMRDVLKYSFKLKKMRFFLCGEDIRYLLKSEFAQNFNGVDRTTLENFSGSNAPRRTHAVLGQDVLSKFSCIRYGKVALYVDAKLFKLPATWQNVSEIITQVSHSAKAFKPSDFHDWEDDREHYEVEDYCSLADEHYWDE